MIKGVLVVLGFVALGGLAMLVLGPFLSPTLPSAPQQISNFIAFVSQHVGNLVGTVQGYIGPIFTYVQENALQVTAITGAVGGFFTMVWSKVYKHNVQKKEIETTAKLNDINSEYFQLDAEKRTLENSLEQAKGKITTLEASAGDMKDLKAELDKKKTELETVIAERNQLARLLPGVKDAERLIEDKMKVP